MSDFEYVFPKGADDPQKFLLWNMKHVVISLGGFIFLMTINQTLLGMISSALLLYSLTKYSGKSARGAVMHLLWRIGAPVNLRGLERLPPATVTRFEA